MNLNDKMKEMLDCRAKDMATIREDAVNWIKCTLDEKMVETLVVNQIENGESEFVINFSVAETGKFGYAGLWRGTTRELTGEQSSELAHAISEEIAKIVKEHGFAIIGIPIFYFQGTQQGRVYFKCKEKEQ